MMSTHSWTGWRWKSDEGKMPGRDSDSGLSLSLFFSFQTINRSMEKRKTQREEIACKGCQKEIAQIPDSLSFHSTPLVSLFLERRRRKKQTGNHVQEEQEDEGIDRTISGLPDKKYWGRLRETFKCKERKKDDRKHDAFLVQVASLLRLFNLKFGIPFKNKFYSKVYISLSSVHVTLFLSLLSLSISLLNETSSLRWEMQILFSLGLCRHPTDEDSFLCRESTSKGERKNCKDCRTTDTEGNKQAESSNNY